MSSKTLSVIDLNDPAHLETPLFSLTGQNRLFTSLEKTAFERGATNTFVCTTYEVMCIDDCRVGALLLSLRHDYGGGRKRDLEIVTVDTEAGGEYSPSWSALTVYRVSSAFFALGPTYRGVSYYMRSPGTITASAICPAHISRQAAQADQLPWIRRTYSKYKVSSSTNSSSWLEP